MKDVDKTRKPAQHIIRRENSMYIRMYTDMYIYTYIHIYTAGVDKDEETGVAYYRRAAAAGVAQAQHNLALCILTGVSTCIVMEVASIQRIAQQRVDHYP